MALASMALALATWSGAGEAQSGRKTPYWASISQSEARMRVGPSLDYPASWVYRRRDLPVRVVQVLGSWRKVEDYEGTQGWMHVRLLSDTATAMVRADMADLREAPGAQARLMFRAEKGVVGRVSECKGGWCLFDVLGQRGFARADTLWGAVR